MKTLLFPIRRAALLAALPAAVLVFSACSNGDDDTPPAPEQGRVLISHAAAVSSVPVTAFANDQQIGQLNYGQSSGYINVNAGAATVRINSGTQALASQTLTIAKDQSYSVFAYSPSATIGSNPALLALPDDLSAPAAGQAKVRVVHLALNAPTPVRLTAPSALPGTPGTDITTDVAFGAASAFVPVNAGPLNLSVTAGSPRTQVQVVGDGNTGTGTKNYEAGKIYTVLVRGIAGTGIPNAQQVQAVIIQNN